MSKARRGSLSQWGPPAGAGQACLVAASVHRRVGIIVAQRHTQCHVAPLELSDSWQKYFKTKHLFHRYLSTQRRWAPRWLCAVGRSTGGSGPLVPARLSPRSGWGRLAVAPMGLGRLSRDSCTWHRGEVGSRSDSPSGSTVDAGPQPFPGWMSGLQWAVCDPQAAPQRLSPCWPCLHTGGGHAGPLARAAWLALTASCCLSPETRKPSPCPWGTCSRGPTPFPSPWTRPLSPLCPGAPTPGYAAVRSRD